MKIEPGKIICHAPGDQCLNCDHYKGKADECLYAKAEKPSDELATLRAALEKIDNSIHEAAGYTGDADCHRHLNAAKEIIRAALQGEK